MGGQLRRKYRVCIRYFDRQSPQAYSVSTSHLWAQMCGYGAGETGGNRLCGGSQLLRCGSTEDCKSFVPGCRGAERPVDVRLAPTGAERRPAAHCQGQGAAPIGRLRAAAIIGSRTKCLVGLRAESPIGSRVKRLAQGELMLASTRTGYYLTQTFAGFAASPPFPDPTTSS